MQDKKSYYAIQDYVPTQNYCMEKYLHYVMSEGTAGHQMSTSQNCIVFLEHLYQNGFQH